MPGFSKVCRLALSCLLAGAAFLALSPVGAYVEAPMSLGAVVQQSTHVLLMRVEKVDRTNNLIVFRKVRDLKGQHPGEVIKHNIGRGGLRPNEWKPQMDWAEPGKTAVFFHNGGASETCIGTWWYQAYAGGEWWNHSHAEPFLLRSFAGPPEKLATAVADMLAGKEVVVPCMVDGSKDDLHARKAKIQRLRVSLKLQDYNARRDFVGWGGEDFRRLTGMPGFSHATGLGRVDPEARAVSAADIDGDGKADLCLAGGGRVAVFQNGGEALSELTLPGAGGGRSAAWADYDGDGRPDLLLATPLGAKLYTNLGGGQFRDDSGVLPREAACGVTAAAWLDHDGDGRPDIALANGYHGLRLYRNLGQEVAPSELAAPRFGRWYYLGPLDNSDNRAFDRTHPVEEAVDLAKSYPGRAGETAAWKEGNFTDGQVNSLTLFRPENNSNAAVYLYREVEAGTAAEVPVSLGSDDTLTVWLNGKKVHAENVARACAPDQARLSLKLQPGKNRLLLKICQGGGEWAFYFKAQGVDTTPQRGRWFEDVSRQAGLGPDGIGAGLKGDTLSVADVNGDGRPDLLYGAGRGLLLLGGQGKFAEAATPGIDFRPGRVAPVFADCDGDGKVDLFVPQDGMCKLFRGDGHGKFTDVTPQAGDLARPIPGASCAALADFDGDGKPDLFVGCLRAPNRFFRNLGGGKFADATAALGWHRHIYNTRALSVLDVNGDGTPDLVLNNEGQESAVLLGSREFAGAQ